MKKSKIIRFALGFVVICANVGYGVVNMRTDTALTKHLESDNS